jgi:hypothetical protein
VDERFLPQSPKNSLDTVYLLPHDGNIYSYYYYYTNNRRVYLVTRSSSCSDCGTTYEHSYSSSYSSTWYPWRRGLANSKWGARPRFQRNTCPSWIATSFETGGLFSLSQRHEICEQPQTL